jgi:hypothetical protein
MKNTSDQRLFAVANAMHKGYTGFICRISIDGS